MGQTNEVKSQTGSKAMFFMGWFGIPKQTWRGLGIVFALLGAFGLIAPYSGFQFLSAPASVFLLLMGFLINVGNS